MPGTKRIRWNKATMETIMATHRKLVQMGVKRPSIRMVLYMLLELPGWEKKHYDTLCAKLGQWRDEGLIEFGLFADDGGGQGYRPLTSREIVERIQMLRDLIPARLPPDGYLYIIFVEHIGLVDNIADLLDYDVPVISSQGQLRREHLYSFLMDCQTTVHELGGRAIRMLGLTDYDRGGLDIYDAHKRWIRRIFHIEMERWAITPEQVRAAGLPDHETHQLDGWMARYSIARLQRELREAVGLSP